MRRLVNLTQKVSPELNQQLEATARKQDMSKAAVVRESIRQYLERNK